MMRSFVLLFNMLGVLFLNFMLSEDVSLSMDVPTEVSAGAEFDVEVTLKKGALASFARFQQDLPLGLSAQAVDPANSNFTFENQKVKFIWLRLPMESEFKVMYRVRVDERLKGQFDLKGLFSYIEGNERKSVPVGSNAIVIRPSSKINPELIVDINEFQNLVPVQPPVSLVASNVRCIRQQPYVSGDNNDMVVNVLVSKGSTEKFAKIEEAVPQGYRAEAIETRDAIFSYKDGTVKFIWMNLPAEQRFVVSYKLIPDNGVGEPNPKIDGKFSFILNDATQVIDVVQREVNLASPDAKTIEGLISSVPAPNLSISTGKQPTSTSFTPSADGGVEIPVEYKKIEGKPRRATQPIAEMVNMLEPEEGVYYRVQIAAGHKLVNVKRYFGKYNIKEEVRTEEHQGWYKYSIGSFPEYKLARDYRVTLWNTTPINDAFVAAYNNGNRITVQEALMITNQKWYR